MTKPLHASAKSTYTKLPIAEKRTLDLANAREAHVRCPGCGVAVMPADLLGHVGGRCPGRPEPGPRARWLRWGEACGLGLESQALARLVQHGHVRMRGKRRKRELLMRDVVLEVARMRLAKLAAPPAPLGSSGSAAAAGGEARGCPLPPSDRIL